MRPRRTTLHHPYPTELRNKQKGVGVGGRRTGGRQGRREGGKKEGKEEGREEKRKGDRKGKEDR